MTHHSSSIRESDEIDFTAAYGTSVAMTDKRGTALRSQQLAALRMPPPCERK